MGTVLIAFTLGGLVGLLARPLLDAYLFWRTAEHFRGLSGGDTEPVPHDEEAHRTTGV
jgi:hypothetical protein